METFNEWMNLFSVIAGIVIWTILLGSGIWLLVEGIKEKYWLLIGLGIGVILFFLMPVFALALTLFGIRP